MSKVGYISLGFHTLLPYYKVMADHRYHTPPAAGRGLTSQNNALLFSVGKHFVIFGTMLCCFLLANTIRSIRIFLHLYAHACPNQDNVLNTLFLFVAVGFQLDGLVVRKNVDFMCCFACSPRMLHPLGDKYIAGHCNIPYIYDSPY